jgi:hypothetical protein
MAAGILIAVGPALWPFGGPSIQSLTYKTTSNATRAHLRTDHALEEGPLHSACERFAPDPNQQSLFTPQPVAGTADEPSTEDASNGSANDEHPMARDWSLKARKKRIVLPQFLSWRVRRLSSTLQNTRFNNISHRRDGQVFVYPD